MIKGTMSGTQLRTGLNRLVAPTDKVKKTMDKYNISLKLNEDGTVNLLDTMKHMRAQLGELSETERASVLVTLMGQEAMAGWASIITATDDKFDELTEAIYNSEGATKRMAKTMSENFKGKLENLSGSFDEVKITIGNILIPVLEKLVDRIASVMDWFTDLDGDTQKLIVGIGAIAAAIGPALVAIGSLGKAILGAKKNLGPMIDLFKMVAPNVGLATASIYLAIGALVALMAYVGSSNTMLSNLQREFGVVGEVIGVACEMIYGAIQATFGGALIWIKGLGKALMALARGDFKEAGSVMKDTMAEAEINTIKSMSNMTASSTQAISNLRKMGTEKITAFKDDYTSTMETLKDVTHDNMGETAKVFAEQFKDMDYQALTTFRGTSDTMALLLNGITANMKKNEMEKIFEQNMQKMMRAGELTTDTLEKDFAKATQTIADNMMTGSKEVESAGKTIFENFKNASTRGMSETVDLVVADVQKMNNQTFEELTAMGGSWGQIFAGITDKGNMSAEELKTAITKNISDMKMSSSELMSALEEDMKNHLQGITTSAENEFIKLPEEVQKNVLDMVEKGGEASKLKESITKALEGTGADASKILSELGIAVDEKTSEAASKAEVGVQKVDNSIKNGLSNIASSVDSEFAKLPVEVQESVTGMINAGASASEVKTAITNGISGTGADASAILSELGIVVDAKTSEAASKAESGGQKVDSGIKKGLSNVVSSVGNAFKGASTSVEKETGNIAKSAETNMSKVSKTTSTNSKNASDSVKRNATDMYNGAKTSFSKMSESAISSTNTMKNNVINNVAIMKNSVIRFWSEIRSELSKGITGEVKITKNITEKVNKVVTVTTENEGGKSLLVSTLSDSNTINLTEKNSAMRSLAIIKSTDKIEANEEKKDENPAQVIRETKNVTYNYSYTSPKESSISELRRKDRIQAQRLALSRR